MPTTARLSFDATFYEIDDRAIVSFVLAEESIKAQIIGAAVEL